MAVKSWNPFPDGFRLINGTHLNRLFTAVEQMNSINVAGSLTPAGGIVGPNRIKVFPVPGLITGALTGYGTSTATVAGSIYLTEVVVPYNMTVTGVGVLNGATAGGTDNGLVALFNSAGALVANSALAGAATSGPNTFQQRAFTGTYAAVGPGRYWIGYQSNGTTDTIRLFATATYLDIATTLKTGAFGALPAITPVSTFTALNGAVAYLY